MSERKAGLPYLIDTGVAEERGAEPALHVQTGDVAVIPVALVLVRPQQSEHHVVAGEGLVGKRRPAFAGAGDALRPPLGYLFALHCNAGEKRVPPG